MKICKNLGYRLSGRWQDKIGLQHPEEKNFALGIAYAWWKCSWRMKPSCWTLRRPTPMTTWKPRSRETSTRSTTWTRECARSCCSLRSLVLSHSSLAHRTLAQDVRVFVSFHPMVIAMHAWSERSLWLPWSLHHLHLPPLIPHYHQAVPYAMKFEDRSQEETERQHRCARSSKKKNKTRLHSTFPRKNGCSRLREQKSRRKESLWQIPERICLWSAKDLSSADLEAMRTSKSLTTVVTANGEVQTRGEATENVKQLNLFVTVMLLEETPAVLSLEETLWRSFVYLSLDQRPKTTSHQKGQENWLQHIKLCAIRCPCFVDEFLHNIHTFFNIFIAGFCTWHQQIHGKSRTRTKWKYEWAVTKNRCINQQKPKTKTKMKDAKKDKAIYARLDGLASGFQREFGRWK